MSLRRRILIIASLVLVVALGAVAAALSYNAPCREPLAGSLGEPRMQAVVYRCYGSADVLRVEQVEKPTPKDDQVLVKVAAAGLNPLDWHYMTGEPYIMRLSTGLGAPKDHRVGVDFAGVVESVGKNVTRFKPGDHVFGGRNGALGEYVVVGEQRAIAHKPANVSFEQAGSVAIAGVTALQALRDKGRLKPGQKVLINGASGGVGTFAVQMAKAYGAQVTGVCSTRNVELVRSLGADRVVDYTQQDFTALDERYDLIVDNVGNHSFMALRRVLQPTGVLVTVGGPKKDPWLGPMIRPLKANLLAPFVDQELTFFLAELKQSDLTEIARLMTAGQVTPVIDHRYTLNEVQEAMTHMGSGRARGKIVLTIDEQSAAPALSRAATEQ